MELPEFLTKKYMGIPGWAIVGVGIGVGAFILWRQKAASTTTAATTGTAGGTASPSTYGDWQYGYGTGSNPQQPPPIQNPPAPSLLSQIESIYTQQGQMVQQQSPSAYPAWAQWWQGFDSSLQTMAANGTDLTPYLQTAQSIGSNQQAYQATTVASGTNPAPTPQIAAPAPAFLSGAPA